MIVSIEVRDPVPYEQYKVQVPALIRKHGGEYLARGGATRVIEGDWRPSRLVLFRFPGMSSVEAFLNDPDYQPLKALRHRVAEADIVAVEGV